MNRNPDKIEQRRLYVIDRIRNKQNGETTVAVVREIAAELFVSEATIWKDFQKTATTAPKRY